MIPNEVYTFCLDNGLVFTHEQGLAMSLLILETRKDEIGRAPSSKWGHGRLNELQEAIDQVTSIVKGE